MIQSIGIPAISNRVKALGDLLIGGLKEKGYNIISPRLGESWSGIVSFAHPTHSHEKIFQDLRNKRIEIALRVNRLRCSAHFYNTEAQIQQLLAALPA